MSSLLPRAEGAAAPEERLKDGSPHQALDETMETDRRREQTVCQEHQRPLEVFCRTDQMSICTLGSATKHRGHDTNYNDKQAGRQDLYPEQCRRPCLLDTPLPPPGEIQFHSVTSGSVSLSWGPPEGLNGPHKFIVTWGYDEEPLSLRVDGCSVTVDELQPGKCYQFHVATEGEDCSRSRLVSASVLTAVPVPRDIQVNQSGENSFTLNWSKPEGMEKVPQRFLISYCSQNTKTCAATTEDCYKTLSDLKPGTQYTVSVSTVLNGEQSEPVSITICTGPTDPASDSAALSAHPHSPEPALLPTERVPLFMDLLKRIGLEYNYENNKLMLSSVLEIKADTTSDETPQTLQSLPGTFLKKLMMANVNARSVMVKGDLCNSERINPLDLITAVFLCSDGFLQQQIVLKMSQCQFAVPLLLPNCDTKQSTLMLWALRDIVKKFRPSLQTDSKSFVEERIVVSGIPMVSFVRLGESSLSKSQILNKLLGNPQQYNDTFVHHDMEGGDVPRVISDGLVEISWYLPWGNKNMDRFTNPVAFANLRGDIRYFKTQFYFLCKTSAIVFVFIENYEADFKILQSQLSKTQLFLVVNSQKDFTDQTLTKLTTKCSIDPTNVIVKKRENDTKFVKILLTSVSESLRKSPKLVKIESMADIACKSGILVDENSDDCQSAKKMADEITRNITDTSKFKEEQLPLQGKIWKEISQVEKERCRLNKAGNEDIEKYKSSLKRKQNELRQGQKSINLTNAGTLFISGMSGSGVKRNYFLKWMQINLDNISQKNVSEFQDKYKALCKDFPGEKVQIAELDKISDCSLGLEHFLRELGQLYESSSFPPEKTFTMPNIQDLPPLCAQMLLDFSFPIELIDGDASNIPLKWISAVLTQLHSKLKPNSKIRVVTVLGVQGTGKSTLLNTMFGVQFAVSSGRCTRGAFMQLIKVNNNLKEELKCDFIMVIDTEGLKSPELAQLDDSYEHDNELATLVIGLSDVTIINIAMENSSEMKDILQIVVHAFIRMKEVGKRPICHFVHQNVSDISAYDKNIRARKKLLEYLDEMTLAAAKMEKKENITKFTDVMDYDPDTSSSYIPGLWHGTPPMAPVNAGYSETVNDFKESLMQILKECRGDNDLTGFLQWTKSLWESVKFEKFIFSFRNSLVADAYTRLCTEYNGWEWSFQKEMYSWMVCAENNISNFGTDSQSQMKENVLEDLLTEASDKIAVRGNEIQGNIVKYFEKQTTHVNLVEKYKDDFVASANILMREMENKVRNTLHRTVEIKEGMAKLEKIKCSHAETMEKKVLDLLKICRENKSDLLDMDLEKVFESMWNKSLSEINFSTLPTKNIFQDAFLVLRGNLSTRGGFVNSMFVENNLRDCGTKPFDFKSGNCSAQQLHHIKEMEKVCNKIITKCLKSITQRVESKTDYYDTYIKELLEMIDETLLQNKDCKVNEECEVSLKLHICGIAANEFQKMHDDFITVNDPRKCLEQSKNKYLTDFIDLFHERDQWQKKAKDFTKQCLQPAVIDYVTKMIGPDVVDLMKRGKDSEDYSTRGAFQFSMLKQLLINGEYDNYKKYISDYEQFVKDWLFDHTVNELSKESSLKTLEKLHLTEIVKLIADTIVTFRNTTSTDEEIKTFIQNFCSALGHKLVLPKDALNSVMTLNYSRNTEQFANNLIEFVQEMEQSLAAIYDQEMDIKLRLRSLPFKPQDKMFTSLFGCGEVCPFCKAPCEAGAKEHSKHFTSIHRPQGVSGWKTTNTKVLVTDICSSDVISDNKFNLSEVGACNHPYKDYQKYFPEWIISGDPSIEASDYWKYVMATFNERIAKDNDGHPADIPEDWKTLTTEDAMKCLKATFNVT
ncbi:interferon-induced very large GTPase 1 isoform X2 [Esox lucius]|uniref:interferon-induced very large GTPase 1 isoform X2 n=1 Tax=Esox lucius TaxID=8010 RepID=UPI001476E88A|nr:interferon-induced very large GTPase 1 isoform X2 [Esox lucius]